MIACAMIVGPGESHRYLDRTLRLAGHWADRIFVYLDGADRDTLNAVEEGGATSWRAGGGPRFTTNESYVRHALLHMLDDDLDAGDLVVVLDADEELTARDGTPRRALRHVAGDDRYVAWPVLFRHLWEPDGRAYRVDGGWRPDYKPRIYRHAPGLAIAERQLACSAIPDFPQQAIAPWDESSFVIRHWGYARPHDRQAKYDRYMAIDGGRFHSRAHLESILTTPVLEPCAT
jgi:hypothetical protein